KKEGFNIVTASSGKQGLELAKKLRPAAITLDLVMPGMDGWSDIQELKNNPNTENIPVIIISMVDNIAKGKRFGVSDYLIKPFNKEHLIGILGNFQENLNAKES